MRFGAISSLEPVILHTGRPSGLPSSLKVFCSTRLYWPFARLKLKGSLRATGGLVIMRMSRRKLREAECSMNGWRRKTSPTSPVASWKDSSFVYIEELAQRFQQWVSLVTIFGVLREVRDGHVPSGWLYYIILQVRPQKSEFSRTEHTR
jgi:hypothetical protein